MRPEDEYRLRREERRSNFSSTTSNNDDPYYGRRRHGCLSLWLYAIVVLAGVSLFLLLPYLGRLMQLTPLPTLVLVGTIISESICAYFVLQWKRWAVNALVVSMVVSFVLEVFITVAQVKDFIQLLVGLGILLIFVQPNLDDYE